MRKPWFAFFNAFSSNGSIERPLIRRYYQLKLLPVRRSKHLKRFQRFLPVSVCPEGAARKGGAAAATASVGLFLFLW